MKKIIKWTLIGLGAFFGLMILAAAIGAIFAGHAKGVSDSPDKKDSVISSNDSIATSHTAEPSPAAESSWNYSEDEDKMTSKKTFTAEVRANDELDLKFPYGGGVTATIGVRYKNGENNIYLQLSKGQFMVNVADEEAIAVRFDGLKTQTYYCSAASDGSTNVIFINNENKFISYLKKSDKMLIEAELFDNGNQQMEFNVNGFKWDH